MPATVREWAVEARHINRSTISKAQRNMHPPTDPHCRKPVRVACFLFLVRREQEEILLKGRGLLPPDHKEMTVGIRMGMTETGRFPEKKKGQRRTSPLTFFGDMRSFPNTGGDAVSGVTHSPYTVAEAVGVSGRRPMSSVSLV